MERPQDSSREVYRFFGLLLLWYFIIYVTLLGALPFLLHATGGMKPYDASFLSMLVFFLGALFYGTNRVANFWKKMSLQGPVVWIANFFVGLFGLFELVESNATFWLWLTLSPIAFLVLGLLIPRTSTALEVNETKTCPFCAEIIKLEANVCRYCGRYLPADLRTVEIEQVANAALSPESTFDDPGGRPLGTSASGAGAPPASGRSSLTGMRAAGVGAVIVAVAGITGLVLRGWTESTWSFAVHPRVEEGHSDHVKEVLPLSHGQQTGAVVENTPAPCADIGPWERSIDAEACKLMGEGNGQLLREDFHSAIGLFQRALSLKPSERILANLYRSMGIAQTRLGNMEEGAHYYRLYLPFCSNQKEKAHLCKRQAGSDSI